MPGKSELIDFIDYSVKMNKLYMGFSKKAPDYKDLNSKFNEGLKAIEASGELDAIKKSYGLD